MKNKEEKIKILLAAAEAAPLIKVGGLGDVVGSLPPALNRLGCDVRLIIPKYKGLDEKKFKFKKILSDLPVKTSGRIEKINLWQTELPTTKNIVYLIENKKYFNETHPYAGNNSEKFLFFSLAIIYTLPLIPFIPQIIHCHDFHTAMLTDLVKADNFYSACYKKTKTLYTIHNLNYQGQSDLEVLKTGNLHPALLQSLSHDAQDGDINFMAQGIINADAVTTVSPTYAREIKTSTYGAGLEKVIRQNQNKLSGIINGLDTNFFNPEKDNLIFKKYGIKNKKQKIKNKTELFKATKIKSAATEPLIAMVSRLSWQKGVDLIDEELIKLPARFIILGTGEPQYEAQLKKLAEKHPQKIKTVFSFNEKLAHRIYAAADMIIVPSRYEPCGLTQMIAMRYGTVPIVRATGGLADTVDNKVGFKFKKYNSASLRQTLQKALNIYKNKPTAWSKLQTNGMKKDWSWNKPAKEYLKLYQKLVKENTSNKSRKSAKKRQKAKAS